MTIRENAFRLFNKITKSSHREEVRNVVAKLKYSKHVYGNKIYPVPFLGLLLYDQKVIKDFEGVSPDEKISLWDERERGILYGVHSQVANLNWLCIAPLEKELPGVYNALITSSYKQSYGVTHEYEELLFSKEDAEEMAESFAQHPAVKKILLDLSEIKNYVVDIRLEQLVIQFLDELTEAGVGGDATWVDELEYAQKINHPNFTFQRYLAALVCLNNSLANIDQLIYQAVFQDSLSHIRRSDAIDYLITTTNSGLAMSINYLENRDLFYIEPTDLIFTSISPDFENSLCCIHAASLSPNFRSPNRVDMRVINDDMCSYNWILR